MGPAEAAIRDLLESNHGLAGSLTRLPGENRNFLVRAADGRRFVLKITPAEAAAGADGGWEREFVRDPETLEPADAECAELVERMQRRGFLLSVDGPLHNVVQLEPPLAIRAAEIDAVLRALEEELVAMAQPVRSC